MARARSSGRGRLRRLLAVVTLLGVLGLAAAVGLNLHLTSGMGRIDGAFDGPAGRPPAAPGETILMVGTRPRGSGDVSWLQGEQAVESVMLVEVDADGRSAQVESVPMPYDEGWAWVPGRRAPRWRRSSRPWAVASTT